ncbi:histidine kinase N-terminal domain-containing protein [Rhodococcus sp. BP-252]|uniref:sensor histidine kinase n=1 Tax=unclassified Rhodococcus (in: high G+C Gram-positive bacteria) TaxID=192944 RepID=UPI001C9AA892|nr:MULTISPECIES: PAS domain-containing sensor histidine kinase [unclassified Rhodococcus (in: high G+C Gram-positive bacteria)]MBY6412439.1 histidine kinase N-terminal domain-containing protein [Rhodococcus sp. BP-320]MBY6417019.1 histidine kinase N-terminal domain-containing protein [Rhodococcus sp. BP-321]MBY6422018.1 histidine kinase N-terminal domain-containing protein [Rhodococcus sp. BP-324]MBY6427043.1 histidine kinase N-terminal domain-containing protein [Rhodococcus sp. BP-323]MBY6432
MSTLSDLLAEHTDLPGEAVDHLQRVVGEWQLLADLSFADLLLWVGTDDVEGAPGAKVLCVAQCRPTTAPTAFTEDMVGAVVSESQHPTVIDSLVSREIVRGEVAGSDSVPVRCGEHVIAVLTRDVNPTQQRPPSALEIAYRDSADDLCRMIGDGTFPTPVERTDVNSSPRAGDGFIRLDTEGRVVYASPNALSAYHRMGLSTELSGRDLASVTRSLITDPFDSQEAADHIRATPTASVGHRMEVDARGATVLIRTLSLRPHGRSVGAIVLVRDVTEVKRRDRALLSKDATIREIHHRVKNNLQTVAALLRLQSRRTENEEARVALSESVRRVTSIAVVHEMLSMSVDEEVDLDEIVDRLVPIMLDVGTVDPRVRVKRTGKLGVFSAERATPLVMVLTELVQNAMEHGFEAGTAGTVLITADRSARWLDVVIHDDGQGLPTGFSLERSEGLGLQIVRTLVSVELNGSLGLHPAQGGGTDASLRVPLGRRPRTP